MKGGNGWRSKGSEFESVDIADRIKLDWDKRK